MKERKTILLSIVLLFLAAAGRLLPHFPNLTPVAALALYAGARFSPRMAMLWVWSAMALSDGLLYYLQDVPPDGWTSLVVYLSLALATTFGRWFARRERPLRFFEAAVGSATFFFLSTNAAVFFFSTLYPKTVNGLVACYVAALPFYRNDLLGTFLWGAVLFSLEWLAVRLFAKRLLRPLGSQ